MVNPSDSIDLNQAPLLEQQQDSASERSHKKSPYIVSGLTLWGVASFLTGLPIGSVIASGYTGDVLTILASGAGGAGVAAMLLGCIPCACVARSYCSCEDDFVEEDNQRTLSRLV